MAIDLDTAQTSNLPPIIGARGIGQTVIGMVIDKQVRKSINKDGSPKLNSKGNPASEEVLTIVVMDGTDGVVSGKDLDPDWTPDVGSVARMIFGGRPFGQLIDARKAVGGTTQVGDVVTVKAETAVIWRGRGDIAVPSTTDPNQIAQARAKNLTIGWNLSVEYRRALPAEAGLVAQAEQLHVKRRDAVQLDDPDDEIAF